MQATNPVRSVSGRGDPRLRGVILHELMETDSVTELAEEAPGARATVNKVLKELRDEGYLDDMEYTDDGITALRKTQRALQDHITEAWEQQLGYTPEPVIGSWTGLEPHNESLELGTEPSEALKWLAAISPTDDLTELTDPRDVDDIRLDDETRRWLESQTETFYLRDAPMELPLPCVKHIGGGLFESRLSGEPIEVPDEDTQIAKALDWMRDKQLFTAEECPFSRSTLDEIPHVAIVIDTPANGRTMWRNFEAYDDDCW